MASINWSNKPHVIGASKIFFGPTKRFTFEGQVYAFLKVLARKEANQAIALTERHFFSGPMRYGKESTVRTKKHVIAADLNAAYATFMLNNKLPGKERKYYHGYVQPKEGEMALVTMTFRDEHPSSKFRAYFLNEAAFGITRDARNKIISRVPKIDRYKAHGVKGYVNFVVGPGTYDIIMLFQSMVKESHVISTVICKGKEQVYINRKNLKEMIEERYTGDTHMKSQLAASTGFIKNLDVVSYMYLIQSIKQKVFKKLLHDIEFDDIMAINTDGVIFEIDDPNTYMSSRKEEYDITFVIDPVLKRMGISYYLDKEAIYGKKDT